MESKRVEGKQGAERRCIILFEVDGKEMDHSKMTHPIKLFWSRDYDIV
jgi:hypothetical protein